MATEPLPPRAPAQVTLENGRINRLLGHPLAFLATTAILVAIFSWTFAANPGRPAAADDPAYYQWRTEALLANDPQALLDVDGPLDMYAGGYRVATPVLAGLMRRVMDVGPLTPTILIGIGLRVALPLLLAGFAYRWRRDPLLWHATAFFTASLLPTPPFAGYLDNVMTLFFLTASLFLIDATRRSWPARIGFVALLLASGFTHPTTLAIFCLSLGVAAGIRFIARGFAFKRTLIEDGWMLGCALAAAVLTYVTWKVGVWGEPASLGEAALPPPAEASFFQKRLGGWIRTFRLPLNGPLLVIGLIGMLRAGRAAFEETSPRVTLAWLLPLIGIAGALVGLAYPYYRFFNTTTAWLLLIGIGAYFLGTFCLDVARRRNIAVVGLLAVVALGIVVATNFKTALANTHWNDVADGWIKPDEQRDLDALRARLADENRPVVFVVDDEIPEEVRIYGFLKRAGNVLRYAVPQDLQDETALYLGSLENFRARTATDRDPYYRELSAASLADVEDVVDDAEPVVVLATVFNKTGANTEVEVIDTELLVAKGNVTEGGADVMAAAAEEDSGGTLRILTALVLGVLLLLPGVALALWTLPDARWVDLLGLAPALAVAALVLVGIGVLAVASAPLTEASAWLVYAITAVVSLTLWWSRRMDVPTPGSGAS